MAQAGFKKGTGGASPADLLVQLGPTLFVDIGLKSRARPGETPDLPLKDVRALIDTGAGGDCIDDDLAKSLSLPVTDERSVASAANTLPSFILPGSGFRPWDVCFSSPSPA